MQPHDPERPTAAGPRDEPASRLADGPSRDEHQGISTRFSPDTGRRTRRGVAIGAVVLVLCLLLVSAVRYFRAHGVAEAASAAHSRPAPVDVVIAKAPTAGQDLVLPGETAAWFETTLYARVNGYVASWRVDIGDHVKQGQVLATIETPELDAELAAAKAQLQASQAQVGVRKAEAAFSKSTNERWRDSPQGVVSEQERESKKADYESAEARLQAAKAQVALDQSKVDQYKALTEFRQVKAPFDGTITERKIDVGNLVTAGSGSTTTSLYRMAQTDPLRVFVDVPQSASGELMNPGVPAEIHATGAVAGVFVGTIARSAEALDSQARTMRVEVDLPNAKHLLVPGMYVQVGFTLPTRGSVEVPAAALIFRPSSTQVAKVDSAGRIEFSDVTIVRDNGSQVELKSGAKPGDRLVLNISSQIAAGDAVAAHDADRGVRPAGAGR